MRNNPPGERNNYAVRSSQKCIDARCGVLQAYRLSKKRRKIEEGKNGAQSNHFPRKITAYSFMQYHQKKQACQSKAHSKQKRRRYDFHHIFHYNKTEAPDNCCKNKKGFINIYGYVSKGNHSGLLYPSRP